MSKFLELTGKICVVLFQIFLLIFVLPKVLKWKNRKIAKEYKENSEKNGEPKQKNSAFKNVMSRVSCVFFCFVFAGICAASSFVCCKTFEIMAVNVCAGFSKNQQHGTVLRNMSGGGSRPGIWNYDVYVEVKTDSKTEIHNFVYEGMNPICFITGIKNKNNEGDDVIVCFTKNHKVLKNTILNSILDALFFFLCFAFVACFFGYFAYKFGRKVIKDSADDGSGNRKKDV